MDDAWAFPSRDRAVRGTARLQKGRNRGPVFVTHRRPGPGKVISPRDICPDTGFARLSYGQARALLDEHTAVRGPGTGWDLHEYRHSSLTHLGEAGTSLLMPMAKSRHKKPRADQRWMALVSRNSSRPKRPISRPLPDCL
jgi:integrase/recombinase XerC